MARSSALAANRRLRGHTQESLAQTLGVDVSSVARWERGTAQPSPRVRVALAHELALSLEQLANLLPAPDSPRASRSRSAPAPRAQAGDEAPELIKDRWGQAERDALAAHLQTDPAQTLASKHGVRVAHQWLITPAPPTVAESHGSDERTQRIGKSTLKRLHARLRYLHHADDLLAGGDLHTIVQDDLARTANLVHTTSYTESIGRDLLRVVAELSELAGWSTADAGHTATAEHYYLHGIQAAHAAGDPVLAAHLVSSLGYHLTETGTAALDAVLVTHSALARMDHLPPTEHSATPSVRALLCARAAWAHATAGQPRHAAEQIQRAQDEYARREHTDPDPAWIYWLTPNEMDTIVGRLDTVLGRPEQGQQRLDTALRYCDPRRVRETAIYTTWLACAHLHTHETECARLLGNQARQLSASIPSTYSNRALAYLSQQLDAS